MKQRKHLISTQIGHLFNVVTTDEAYLYDRFRYLKDCGFEAIDYQMDDFLPGELIWEKNVNDFWDADLETLYKFFAPTKKALHDSGLVFSQAHASFPVYKPDNGEINDYMIMVMEKSLAVCRFLGCPALVVHPYMDFQDVNPEREYPANLAMYRKLIPAAKKYGVTVCLENYYQEVAIQSRMIDELNAEAGDKHFGFCLDIGHANHNSDGDFCKYIQILGERLTCLHIHENDGANDSHMIPFTQTKGGYDFAQTNYAGMIRGLKEIGYEGNLSFETFRGLDAVPKEVEPEVLKLISAIGRYFRAKLEE